MKIQSKNGNKGKLQKELGCSSSMSLKKSSRKLLLRAPKENLERKHPQMVEKLMSI